MIRGWPSRSDSHGASRRATMSGPPPAALPTINRTGRVDWACTTAILEKGGAATTAPTRHRYCRRASFMALFHLMRDRAREEVKSNLRCYPKNVYSCTHNLALTL